MIRSFPSNKMTISSSSRARYHRRPEWTKANWTRDKNRVYEKHKENEEEKKSAKNWEALAQLVAARSREQKIWNRRKKYCVRRLITLNKVSIREKKRLTKRESSGRNVTTVTSHSTENFACAGKSSLNSFESWASSFAASQFSHHTRLCGEKEEKIGKIPIKDDKGFFLSHYALWGGEDFHLITARDPHTDSRTRRVHSKM